MLKNDPEKRSAGDSPIPDSEADRERDDELDDEEYDDEFDDEELDDEEYDDELDDEEYDDELDDEELDDEEYDDELDDEEYDDERSDDDEEYDDERSDDDEEYDDDDLDEEEYRREKQRLRKTSKTGRSSRSTQITLTVVIALISLGYGSNVWVNTETASHVRQVCHSEDERLSKQIAKAVNDEMPAMDWMVSLYRARRRYSQEICGGTLEQLTWWRWNLTQRINVDISSKTQTDITRVLARAGSSCEGEIETFEKVLNRELTLRKSPPSVKQRAARMVKGQLESCRELRTALSDATPGFWPPLKASGPRDVPAQLKKLMPRATAEPSAPGQSSGSGQSRQ